MRKYLNVVVGLLIVGGLGFVLINYYSFIFAKSVQGEIVEVERVTQPAAILGGNQLSAAQIYSFAIAIRDKSGEIFTSSSEDRQWAVAKKGFCATAKFYPYPPWELDKSGTYFNARLIQLKDCQQSGANAAATTPPESQNAPAEPATTSP